MNIEDRNLEIISKDAQDIQIPEGLSPDNMMAKIAKKKAEGYFAETVQGEKKSKKRSKINKKMIALMTSGMATIAAAASLGIILLGSGAAKFNSDMSSANDLNLYNSIAENNFDDEHQVENLSSYESLAKYYISQNTLRKKQTSIDKFKDIIGEMLGGESVKGEDIYDGDFTINESINGLLPELDAELNGGVDDVAKPEYSDTNTRTENVSEADIVKTDGDYIYYINRIKESYSTIDDVVLTIIRAYGEETTKLCEVSIGDKIFEAVNSENVDSYSATEMMIYKGKLVVVCNNGGYTVLVFYDIKDRTAPQYINTLYVEGVYDSCRMVDGYLYVFANRSIEVNVNEYGQYIGLSLELAEENIIPCTSQGELSPEDVYISKCEDFNVYHMIGTIDMNDTSDFKQVKAVLGSSRGTVYVSTKNIYYISKVFEGYEAYQVGEKVECSDKSELIKLSYKDGYVEAAGRTVIDGVTGDEFAIDEYNGYLRMAVTVCRWNGVCVEKNVEYFDGTDWVDDTRKVLEMTQLVSDQISALYVLDEDLEVVGSIPSLKEDESVYGVRFDGDIAYVVTYRQMDPLFTIDLSDPTNPTILGALKIPGFSTYLHKWDENTLIGLGYEDEWQVKISTFDISDKTDVKETDICLVEASGSKALSNHKALFISPEKNLVGFMDTYGMYRIFSYVDGVLTEVINVELDNKNGNDARGLYIDQYIYIVGENNGVYVYRMSDYEMVAVVK